MRWVADFSFHYTNSKNIISFSFRSLGILRFIPRKYSKDTLFGGFEVTSGRQIYSSEKLKMTWEVVLGHVLLKKHVA